jgi:hypothetical protein
MSLLFIYEDGFIPFVVSNETISTFPSIPRIQERTLNLRINSQAESESRFKPTALAKAWASKVH